MTSKTSRLTGKGTVGNVPPSAVRCAIYTRKSTEDGLEQEFNSLDAQREAGEAFIASQKHEGWICLPSRYDDGGFTGGNLERPALRRLVDDIEAGLVDCVVVYKVDRLSRSLLDFTRIMATFDNQGVSFVSVTQQFNTTSSMGRLTLNILLSFAQFEREIISERTRDKMAAARRRGKWSGGAPLLGYNAVNSKLVIVPEEAERVRAIFDLYLQSEGLLPVVDQLQRRGWHCKRWTTKKGTERGGRPFNKNSLWHLLTNVTYLGQVKYKDEIHPGEQEAIVSDEVWQQVQSKLQRNGRTGGKLARNKFGALLKGLLHCAVCDCAMSPTHSTPNKTKRYRYYVCCHAQKCGWDKCPAPSIPAGEIERFVVNQIRNVANDPGLIRETLAECQRQAQAEHDSLEHEVQALERDLARWNREIHDVVAHVAPGGEDAPAVVLLADLQERLHVGELRRHDLHTQMRSVTSSMIDHDAVRTALTQFEALWSALTSAERVRVVGLLVERVDYDGERGKVTVTFHPSGLQTFGREFINQEHAA